MHHDLSDPGSLILIQIIPKERTLKYNLVDLQRSWLLVFLRHVPVIIMHAKRNFFVQWKAPPYSFARQEKVCGGNLHLARVG